MNYSITLNFKAHRPRLGGNLDLTIIEPSGGFLYRCLDYRAVRPPQSRDDMMHHCEDDLDTVLAHYGCDKTTSATPTITSKAPVNEEDARDGWLRFKCWLRSNQSKTVTEVVREAVEPKGERDDSAFDPFLDDPSDTAYTGARRTFQEVKKTRPKTVLEVAGDYVVAHRNSVVPSDVAYVHLCMMFITWTLATADCERGFSLLKAVKTAVRNRLGYDVLNQLMMIMINGPELEHFDFDEAAKVFAGASNRLHVRTNISHGAAKARQALSYDWSRQAAAKSFNDVLELSRSLATGEVITDRLVGSAVTSESKETKSRVRKKDAALGDQTYGSGDRGRGRQGQKKKRKTSSSSLLSASASTSATVVIESDSDCLSEAEELNSSESLSGDPAASTTVSYPTTRSGRRVVGAHDKGASSMYLNY